MKNLKTITVFVLGIVLYTNCTSSGFSKKRMKYGSFFRRFKYSFDRVKNFTNKYSNSKSFFTKKLWNPSTSHNFRYRGFQTISTICAISLLDIPEEYCCIHGDDIWPEDCMFCIDIYYRRRRREATVKDILNFEKNLETSWENKKFLCPQNTKMENVPKKECSANLRLGFLNLKTGFCDNKFPQYPNLFYQNRDPKLAKQLENHSIDILGFCEGGPLNRMVELKKLFESHDIVAYCSGKKGSNSYLSIQEALDISKKNKEDPYIGEFVGFIYNKQRYNLIRSCPISLPEGDKHNRICVYGIFNDKFYDKSFVVYVFHLDHLKPQQRKDSLKKLKKFVADRASDVFFMGDTNFFLDQNGEEYYNELISKDSKLYDPRKVANNHYGQDGTVLGDLTWDPKFLPKTRLTSLWGYFNTSWSKAYKESTPLDLILHKKPEAQKFYIPVLTATLPGYFNQDTGDIYKISECNQNVVETASTISDHCTPIVEFELINSDFLPYP